MTALAYTFLVGGDRAATLPPPPVAAPVAPAPAGDDLVAAVVVAARHAAERLEQLAAARRCSLTRALRGRTADRRLTDATADAREIGVLAAAASGALFALHHAAARLAVDPPEGVEPPDVDGAAWALLVAGCVQGPDDDRELAEGLAAWASEHERYMRPTLPVEVRRG